MAPGGGDRLHLEPRKFFADLTARLIAHAEWQFRLSQPLPEGGTLGDAFRQYRRTQGKPHPEDVGGEPLPPAAAHVLEWFWELAAARGASASGPQPLAPTEILAWCMLRRLRLRGWELRALRALDGRWLDVARNAVRGR